MKKIISCTLILVILLLSSITVFAAVEKDAVIKAAFNSDVNGKTIANIEDLAYLADSDLRFHRDENGERSFICDSTNQLYSGAMKAGRTYYIHYEFETAEGTVFPENLDTAERSFSCDDGCSIVNCYYVRSLSDENVNYLYVCEKVTVKGNAIQRILGIFADLILKIRAWSPF